MALIPDPIFYETIRKRHGAKRRQIFIKNTDKKPVEVKVVEVDKPEWLDLEGVFPGTVLKIPAQGSVGVVSNINTNHKFFPTGKIEERVTLKLSDQSELSMNVTLHVTEVVEPFRGVFAMDFGTTNSCYAYIGGALDAHRTGGPPPSAVSPEIPSVMFFHDVSERDFPKFSYGNEARHDIVENSSQTYSYYFGIKRYLGLDKKLHVLDKWAGSRPHHRQEYHVEEVAAFLIRELITRAEEELDKRITKVVATYPPMFSSDRKEGLRKAYRLAFQMLGRELKDEDLVMELDEATSGTFNYIYGTMLDEFRRFNKTESKAHLLAFDCGGGTTDIALVTAEIRKVEGGRFLIRTHLRGLSGDADFGGDNISLQVFKILRLRMAQAVAERVLEREKELQRQKEDAARAQAKKDDIWGTATEEERKSKPSSIWEEAEEDLKKKQDEEEKKKAAEAKAAATADPELQGIEPLDPPDVYAAACRTVFEEKTIIERVIKTGCSFRDAVEAIERKDGTYRGPEESRQRTEVLEKAVETVLPTKFAVYEDKDPQREVLARKLFQEIFQEADMLKIVMVKAAGNKANVQGTLKRSAKYAGVDPIVFNQIELDMQTVNAWIAPQVEALVRKAWHLSESIKQRAQRGIIVGAAKGTPGQDDTPLKVLLFGNSSNLPVIRDTFLKVFKMDPQNLIFEPGKLKNAVARGAAEEFNLRQTFGNRPGGLFQYESIGFLDRLPCAIGLFHKDLALVGFKNGFCPIFARETKVGARVDLSSRNVFMIYRGMRDLAIYADNMDGTEPRYIGYIDFTKPVGKLSPEELKGEQGASVEQGAPPEGGGGGQAQPPAGDEFKLRFELKPNRELRVVNLETGELYDFEPQQYIWNTPQNPFSGMH
ncbi:MAG: Hsp70 family protein [Planctomycetota bacterium]|nr:Hsp70 family protein [Planctomycetota bacterium]